MTLVIRQSNRAYGLQVLPRNALFYDTRGEISSKILLCTYYMDANLENLTVKIQGLTMRYFALHACKLKSPKRLPLTRLWRCSSRGSRSRCDAVQRTNSAIALS